MHREYCCGQGEHRQAKFIQIAGRKLKIFRVHRGEIRGKTATIVCASMFLAACATGGNVAASDARSTASDKTARRDWSDLVVTESAPADETSYVFKLSCHNAPLQTRRHVVVEGHVTSDASSKRKSGLDTITIDGSVMDAGTLQKINTNFPADAIQDRPWILCDNGEITFTIPYRNLGKPGSLRFVVTKDGSVDFSR